MSRNHPNYSIAEVGHNTVTIPGDLRKLAVTQALGKDHWQTMVWKNMFNNNNNNNIKQMDHLISARPAELVIIIIIILSCRLHGYPWPSIATSPYRSSPLAGLQGYIPYPHLDTVCMFELVVLLLLGHMQGSIGVHHLWGRPCFSSSVLHASFV